ncbi:Putative ribonuclease H protein At1g65750 [Linum perenne]
MEDGLEVAGFHGKLITNVKRTKRHMTSDTRCLRCSLLIIGWKPILDSWTTVNTDGSIYKNPNSAADGGLVRNALGYCLKAFTANYICSITRADLRATIEGLEHAWADGHHLVQLEMDSSLTISILTGSGSNEH